MSCFLSKITIKLEFWMLIDEGHFENLYVGAGATGNNK